ncbi:MAG: hypothetical protein ACHQIM_13055 [Sphingobacteriales bacterium]
MKTDKTNMGKSISSTKTAKMRVNPFLKLMEDQERIADAIKNNQPLSLLKDLKFVSPLMNKSDN